MQRRLINALEDLKVKYDGTVRNTSDVIIQFKYGDDGVDPSRSMQGEAVDIDDIFRLVVGKVPDIEDRKESPFRFGEFDSDLMNFATEEEQRDLDHGEEDF
jgi:DNA-directed RNA polymerase subunit A'